MIKIRSVKHSEAELISELAIKSKAYWGYNKEFMDLCIDELSYSETEIVDQNFIYNLAERNGDVLGFYKLENLNSETVLLEALFIDPCSIRQGIGRTLLEHALKTAKQCGAKALEAQSDLNAEPFYLAMGATITGREKSGSIKGRYLPMINIVL